MSIRPYHETYDLKSSNGIKKNRVLSLNNIGLNKITSQLSNNIPATTIGLAFASWSINNIILKKSQKIPNLIDEKNNIKQQVNISLSEKPLTEEDVIKCQKDWSNSIELISAAYLQGGDFVDIAIKTAGELYGYNYHEVLFKPTKATNHPFRATGEEAMSYFVGADNFINSDRFKGEDVGFAINGGKGWKKVVFKNHKIYLDGNTALAMGSYDFTCATTGEITTAEFTFGYKRSPDGKPRIFLHHSSVPYKATTQPIKSNTPNTPNTPNTQNTQNKENNLVKKKYKTKKDVESKIITSESGSTHIHIYTS